MPETYTVVGYDYKGERDNPHGGKLHKFSVALEDGQGETHSNVYWQRKSSEGPSGEVYGDITDGEFGPRFRTAQRPDGSGNQGSSGGTFNRHFERVPDAEHDRNWSIERQVAAKCAAEVVRGMNLALAEQAIPRLVDIFHAAIHQQDLDADVGGGPKSTEASPPTADVSAEQASPQLKGKATQLMNKAGLAEGARKAVIMFRCGTLKDPPKDRLMSLVRDLEDGADHDSLLAEVHDAARAGNNPLATAAAALIPSDTPLAEPEPEVVPPNGDDKVPF